MCKHGSAGSRCNCQHHGGPPGGRKRYRSSPENPKTAIFWLLHAYADDADGAHRSRNAASVRTIAQSNPTCIRSSILQKPFTGTFEDP